MLKGLQELDYLILQSLQDGSDTPEAGLPGDDHLCTLCKLRATADGKSGVHSAACDQSNVERRAIPVSDYLASIPRGPDHDRMPRE